ncbi:MAG: cell division protein FtsQ/DivIB [Flavobacteriaceae bacterium]|jgi:cell division protein FtsQ|nr:hypothetical protein [Flavobacteriaceae bacterium]MCB0484981.1 hypothetical protein [Flavobacteriaceae bacterium]
MKKLIPFIKGLLLLAFIVFLYGFSFTRNKAKNISSVEVSFTNGDNLFITHETVNKLLIQNHGEVKSQPKETIFLNKLENTLSSNEMVENAEVFLSVDGQLGVKVTQKTPIARVHQTDQTYYIDYNGGNMPLSSNYSARVPIVVGVTNSKASEELYALAKFIYEDDFLKKQVVGIEQTPKKEFVLKTRIGDQEIELGSLVNLEKKINKLKAFYQKTINDKTFEQYKKINLMYNNQVVCTKK